MQSLSSFHLGGFSCLTNSPKPKDNQLSQKRRKSSHLNTDFFFLYFALKKTEIQPPASKKHAECTKLHENEDSDQTSSSCFLVLAPHTHTHKLTPSHAIWSQAASSVMPAPHNTHPVGRTFLFSSFSPQYYPSILPLHFRLFQSRISPSTVHSGGTSLRHH